MTQTTLHVISLPHTQTTHDFDHCAFTAKVRKFCGMMGAQGYKTILYAGDENEADCDELVTCITRKEQERLFDWWESGAVQNVSWDWKEEHWQLFNGRVIEALRERVQDRDIICLMTGLAQQPIIDAFPNHIVAEIGVGYAGIATKYRVFESHAWMHAIYGQHQTAAGADGHFFDAVIPNFFDEDEFPAGTGGDYLAFLSRMTPRKGYQIAFDAAKATGRKIKVGGVGGDRPELDYVEYLGMVKPKARSELLGGALATFMPTLYLEPFGSVVVESLLCGTPVICTDWGAFPELVEHGVDGFRCRSQREFNEAVELCKGLDRDLIRERAQGRYNFEAVGRQYDTFFKRLNTLWDKGFYA